MHFRCANVDRNAYIPPRVVTGPSWYGLEIVVLMGEIKGVSCIGGLSDLWHVHGHPLVTRRGCVV